MKVLKCAVRCDEWDRPKEFEVEVPEDATEDEVDEVVRAAAIEQSKLDFWLVEPVDEYFDEE